MPKWFATYLKGLNREQAVELNTWMQEYDVEGDIVEQLDLPAEEKDE